MSSIEAKEIKIVPIGDLRPNPNNRNKHPAEQIKRLEKIIKAQGFRSPIVVSNRSGLVVAGHGRLMAALNLGLEMLPVIYQDFDDAESEYAHMVADNALNTWSELDLAGINNDMADLGPDLDIDLLGIEDFTIDIADRELPAMDDAEHMRQITLHYNPEIYDHITNRLDQMADKLGLETSEAVIAHLLDVNI